MRFTRPSDPRFEDALGRLGGTTRRLLDVAYAKATPATQARIAEARQSYKTAVDGLAVLCGRSRAQTVHALRSGQLRRLGSPATADAEGPGTQDVERLLEMAVRREWRR